MSLTAHHISSSLYLLELRLTWFWKAVVGGTKDPGCSYLRDFKASFSSLEITLDQLVRLDFSSRPEWIQELARETKAWALGLLANNTFPRADYHESLLWLLWHLGVEASDLPGFFPLHFPGPDHQARWMARVIGFPKILACSQIYRLDEEQTRVVTLMTEFIVLFYLRGWLEAPLAASAARSDLTFMRLMLDYYRW